MSELEEKYGLEPQQYEVILQENDVPFHDISSRGFRIYFLGGLVLVLCMLVLGVTVYIPQEVSMPFVLMGGDDELVVRFHDDIYINQKYAAVGDQVEAGVPIMKISSATIRDLLAQLNEQELQRNHLLQKRRQLDVDQQKLLETEAALLQGNVAQYRDQLQVLQGSLDSVSLLQNQQIALLASELDRKRHLYEDSVISASELETAELNWSSAKQQLVVNQAQLRYEVRQVKQLQQEAKNRLALIDRELSVLQTRFEVDEASIQTQVDVVKSHLQLNYGSYEIDGDALIILAEKSGVLTTLPASESRVVSGEIAYRLSYDQQQIYVYGEATSAEIGQLEKGQKAIVKYDSYPHFYYGHMVGIVSSVSRSPNEQGLFPYYITVTNEGNLAGKVNKGMRGTVSVITEELTGVQVLWKTFLGKVSLDAAVREDENND